MEWLEPSIQKRIQEINESSEGYKRFADIRNQLNEAISVNKKCVLIDLEDFFYDNSRSLIETAYRKGLKDGLSL